MLDEVSEALRIECVPIAPTVRAALAASEKIPADLSATAAAVEFCGWMLENLRGDGAKMPGWIYGC